MKAAQPQHSFSTRVAERSETSALVAELFDRGLELPLPAGGATLERWRVLAAVAHSNLSLAKLFEAHVDAIAIMAELNRPLVAEKTRWGVWAAESGKMRVQMRRLNSKKVRIYGHKSWCSGAPFLTHALVTAWENDRGPFLVAIPLAQPHVRLSQHRWHAIGMADTATCDVNFEAAEGDLIGDEKSYLERSGFWHGAAGVAACWYGGAQALADKLRQSLDEHPSTQNAHAFVHLGAIDIALQQTAALMRVTAAWIDANPRSASIAHALRLRGCAEAAANTVLERFGRALGAAPFCEDAHMAHLTADLPVYLRQSHAEFDLAQLGERMLHHVSDTLHDVGDTLSGVGDTLSDVGKKSPSRKDSPWKL